MTKQIVIQVNYTAEDYARSSKFVTMRSSLFRYLWLIPLVIMLICIAYIAVLTKGSFSLSRPGIFISFVLALIVVSLMILFSSRAKYSNLAKRQFQKQIDSSPALRETKTITFDDEGIKGQQVLGTGETHWNGVIEAAETPEDFFFFTAPRFAMFVPKSAFESDKQQEELRSLLKRVLGDRAKNLK